MKFDKILQYQNLDAEILKIDGEIRKSEAFKQFYTYKNMLEAATKTMLDLNTESGDIVAHFEKLNTQANETRTKINEILETMNFDEVTDLSVADYFDRQISTLLSKLTSIEKECETCLKRIDEIRSQSGKTMEQGKTLHTKVRDSEKAYNDFRSTFAEKLSDLMKQMKALEKEIPPTFLAAYASLRKNKTLPAFVEYAPATMQCSRCFMNVPIETQDKLKNPGDHTECPNCRRILFIKD